MQPATIKIEDQPVIVSANLIQLVNRWIELSEQMRPGIRDDVVQLMAGKPRKKPTTVEIERDKEITKLTGTLWIQLVDDNPALDFRGENPKTDIFAADHWGKATKADDVTRKAIHSVFMQVSKEKGLKDFQSPYDPEIKGLHH